MQRKFKYSVLILFYLALSIHPNVIAQNTVDSVLILKKKLEFEKAINKAKMIDDPWVRESLLNILFFETGVKINRLKYPKGEFDVQSRYVFSLSRGYTELAEKRYGNKTAFEYFLSALRIADDSQNPYQQKVALLAILKELRNQVFLGSNQFIGYLDAFERVAKGAEDIAILNLNKTILYSKANDTLGYNIKQYQKAIKELDSIFNLLPKDNKYFSHYYHEKGIENKFSGNSKKAEYYFKIVDSLTKGRDEYKSLRATNYWQLGDMFLRDKQFMKAHRYWELSMENASSLRDTFYDNRLAARLFRGLEDNRKAYEYLEKSNKNEYELAANTYQFMSNQLSKQFEEESKVKYETAQKEKELIVQRQKVKENRNWLIVSTIALVMAAGVAVLLQKNTSKKRQLAEQESKLKQQRVENLLREQELVSIDAMIAGQEKERQKVAGELHDDLGSLMATIKLHFENADLDESNPAIKNAQDLLDEAYKKIRGIAHSKNSGVMSDQGLLFGIKKMAKTITETSVIEVSVEDFGLGERLENSIELSIFRMVQELVANVIKHAEATKVNIQLTQHKDNLNIIVEDNGKGFDRSKLDKSKTGMGLTTIEKRVEHLEGNFTVDSVLGKGTSILIDIPV